MRCREIKQQYLQFKVSYGIIWEDGTEWNHVTKTKKMLCADFKQTVWELVYVFIDMDMTFTNK